MDADGQVEESKEPAQPEIFNLVTNFRRSLDNNNRHQLRLRLRDCNDFLSPVQKSRFENYEIEKDSEIASCGTASDIYDYMKECYLNVTTLKRLEKQITDLIKASGKQGSDDEVQGLAKKYAAHKLITEVTIYIPVRDTIGIKTNTQPIKLSNERRLFLNDNTRHMGYSYKALMRALKFYKNQSEDRVMVISPKEKHACTKL